MKKDNEEKALNYLMNKRHSLTKSIFDLDSEEDESRLKEISEIDNIVNMVIDLPREGKI